MEDVSPLKIVCTQNFGRILLTGEELRHHLHSMGSSEKLIKDHWHHFKTYPSTFVGSEVTTWLVNNKYVNDRETTVALMNVLLENGIIHHVSDSQPFKDEYLLYRFRRDDGTFPWSDDLALFQRCQNMLKRLQSDDLLMLQTREEDGVWYSNAFLGSQLIDWQLNQGDFDTRDEAIREGRRMLENDVIRHVTDAHHFKDELLLYQFKSSFVASTATLQDLVVVGAESDTVDIMSCGGDALRQPIQRNLSLPNDRLSKGNFIRMVSVEELESPGSQFMKKRIRIAQDPVGFGFVLRGEGPVYVQTVDPMGPAAAAGLKVGHYLHSVNDHPVLTMNYRDICHLILGSNGYVNMVVMEYVNDRWR